MQEFLEVLREIWDITVKMSPYLLLGFLLAGIMHAFIPGRMYSRYLSGGSFRSVLYAALFGVPLPLCSCGVIPTAMSLRKEGASKGAAVSFLIATPQTGVDSIIATYSLMGLPFAVVRPVAALCTALFGGQLVNWTTRKETHAEALQAKSGGGCAGDGEKRSFGGRVVEALRYAFVDMMQDIGKWLMIGLVIAGLITALVPDSWFAVFKDNTFLSMLLVLVIAVPMYICATGSIPIAVALMLKGLTPGAALVMLMAGPACNVASMLVVNKVLGRKTLLTYLASIIIGAIAFGFAIDYLMPAEWFMPSLVPSGACHHHAAGAGWFRITCTVLLLVLLAHALIRHYIRPRTQVQTENLKQENTMRIEFKIKGMTCNHCRAMALKTLQSLNGVTAADVDLASSKAYIEGTATLDEIKAAVDEIGFTVE